jgi:hypothetical protein
MRSLDSITFDTTDFAWQGDINEVHAWHTQRRDGIGLFYQRIKKFLRR